MKISLRRIGPSGVRAHDIVRALVDVVATKLGIIHLYFFHAHTFLPEGVCLRF